MMPHVNSSAAHLIWRKKGGRRVRGGGGRGWGGGQRTLHTKGYTELSMCVCALYSVCFSFVCIHYFCVSVSGGMLLCITVRSLILSSSSSSSSCCRSVEREKIETCKEILQHLCTPLLWDLRDFCVTLKKKKKHHHHHVCLFVFFETVSEKRWSRWCHILYNSLFFWLWDGPSSLSGWISPFFKGV